MLTAIDVFSRYLFAYPLTDASAFNVAKVTIDIKTKLAYSPKTLITDKGTAFTSANIAEITTFGDFTKICNNRTSANDRETRAKTCDSQNKS